METGGKWGFLNPILMVQVERLYQEEERWTGDRDSWKDERKQIEVILTDTSGIVCVKIGPFQFFTFLIRPFSIHVCCTQGFVAWSVLKKCKYMFRTVPG